MDIQQVSPETPIKVLLVDDHSLMRDSLKLHLKTQSDITIVAEAGNGEEAIKLSRDFNPDVIIMDITMPRMDGLEAMKRIKTEQPEIAVLILTVHSDTEHILKILEAGADGYLTKNILGDKLAHSIRSVAAGESVLSKDVIKNLLVHSLRYPLSSPVPSMCGKLTAREIEILRLAAKGLSNKDISQILGMNVRTIKGNFVTIFSKLNASSRTEAVITGLKAGLVTLKDVE